MSIPIPEPFSVGYFNQFGNKYANGLYVKATPPNLDRGLTIVNAEAGIMSIGGDYRFGSWSLTTVSAEAKAGASLHEKESDVIGVSIIIGLEGNEK